MSASTRQLTIHLTDQAQERILDLRDSPHQAAKIRLYVQGGGCSGFQYQIEMTQEENEDDFVIEISPWIKLHVDPISAPYLDETTIDYTDEALSSRFTFDNPHAKNTCGCGSSFSVE